VPSRRTGHDEMQQIRLRDPAARSARAVHQLRPSGRQRAQGKPGVRCTRSLVCKVESTRVSHHRFTGSIRLSLHNGFNGLFRALPGDRAFLPPSPCGLAASSARSGLRSASVGASGPHDFAVRNIAVRLHAVNRSRAQRDRPATTVRADAVASTASRPASVTIASRPSGDETAGL